MTHSYLKIFPDIFNFTFCWWAILPLVSIFIFLFFALLILQKGGQNPTNRWYGLCLFAMILWGLGDFFTRISATASGAIFWRELFYIGMLLVPVFYFAFTLNFIRVRHILSNILVQFAMCFPPAVFLFLNWKTDFYIIHDPSKYFNHWGFWQAEHTRTTLILLAWLVIFFLVSEALLFIYYRRLKDEIRKKQALLVFLALLPPLIGGAIFDSILPQFRIQFPEMTPVFTIFLVIILSYALLKYKLFILNPITAFYPVIQTMTESLLVINPVNNFIEMINKAASKLLGYSEEELEDQPIRKIIVPAYWESFQQRGLVPLGKGKEVKNLETKLLTKEGEEIPINFSASAIKEANQKSIGIVAVATDITQTKNLIRKLEETNRELQEAKYQLERKMSAFLEPKRES